VGTASEANIFLLLPRINRKTAPRSSKKVIGPNKFTYLGGNPYC
jgi:hypothetical protein